MIRHGDGTTHGWTIDRVEKPLGGPDRFPTHALLGTFASEVDPKPRKRDEGDQRDRKPEIDSKTSDFLIVSPVAHLGASPNGARFEMRANEFMTYCIVGVGASRVSR